MEVNHIEGYDCIEDNLRILLNDKKQILEEYLINYGILDLIKT